MHIHVFQHSDRFLHRRRFVQQPAHRGSRRQVQLIRFLVGRLHPADQQHADRKAHLIHAVHHDIRCGQTHDRRQEAARLLFLVVAQHRNIRDRDGSVAVIRIGFNDHARNIVQIVIPAKQPIPFLILCLERTASEIRDVEFQRQALQ